MLRPTSESFAGLEIAPLREESPDEMRFWLSDPEKSHGVPDPDSEERFDVVLNWTPINAVSAGRTELVIEAARRYVEAATR